MNDPPHLENQSISEPATTVRHTHLGRNAGAVSLQSGYALPARHHTRGLILIDARVSSCLSRCTLRTLNCLPSCCGAARRTGHSCIVQHVLGPNDRNADYPASQAANVNSEPTFVVINFSGNLRCIAAIKFDPEQCIGKTTSGSMTSNSSIVCSM